MLSVRREPTYYLNIFLVIFKANNLKKSNMTLTNDPKATQEKFFLMAKKFVLKIRLNIRVRNFAALNEPLNIL